MKYTTLILWMLLYSCSSSESKKNYIKLTEEVVRNNTTESFNTDSLDASSIENSLNYRDSSGLKQGKWITKGYQNKIVKIETFEDDVLNGYWFNWHGMQEVGTYKNGKRNGFFRVHYGDRFSKEVLELKLYRNDSLLWRANPAADSRSAIPIKGFKTDIDSIFIKAPHVNNIIWYEGLFYMNEPLGIHKSYDTIGRLISAVNYTDSTIVFTKFADDTFKNSTKMLSFGFEVDYESNN